MADHRAVQVLYIAPAGNVTAVALREALGLFARFVDVTVTPSFDALSTPSDAIIVIDLSHRAAVAVRHPGAWRHEGQTLLVLDESGSIPVSWLGIALKPNVQIMRVPAATVPVCATVGAALQAGVIQRRDQLLNAVIGQHPELLGDNRDLVQAILRDPWGVRTPQQLADSVRVSLSWLKTQLRKRATRPEHFITIVRWCAFEYLVGPLGMTVRRALDVVGMNDRSNLRRQVRRASYLLTARNLIDIVPARRRRPCVNSNDVTEAQPHGYVEGARTLVRQDVQEG